MNKTNCYRCLPRVKYNYPKRYEFARTDLLDYFWREVKPGNSYFYNTFLIVMMDKWRVEKEREVICYTSSDAELLKIDANYKLGLPPTPEETEVWKKEVIEIFIKHLHDDD